MASRKNIVICCDGTGNQFSDTNTNVVKLFSRLEYSDKQIAFYDPGVGTGNPRQAATWTRRKVDQAAGLAFGAGLYRNLSDAYTFLMRNHEDGDRIFIFGFSRGAYTARALTGFVEFAGLLRPGSENLIPYALDLYRKKIPSDDDKRSAHFRLGGSFKATFSRDVRTHFIGIWDAVKTVGLWDAVKISAKLGTALPYTFSMPGTDFGRHAISIDERRSRFRPNSWKSSEKLQQAWFKGVHCDVGGGYAECGLSDIALKWVMLGAKAQGLILESDAFDELEPDPAAAPHESLTWKWAASGLGKSGRFGRSDPGTRKRVNSREPRPLSTRAQRIIHGFHRTR